MSPTVPMNSNGNKTFDRRTDGSDRVYEEAGDVPLSTMSEVRFDVQMAELQQNFNEILKPDQSQRNDNILQVKKSLHKDGAFAQETNENHHISRNNNHQLHEAGSKTRSLKDKIQITTPDVYELMTSDPSCNREDVSPHTLNKSMTTGENEDVGKALPSSFCLKETISSER